MKARVVFLLILLMAPLCLLPAQSDAASVQELYRRGLEAYERENFYRAIEMYKTALQMSPAYLDPLRGLAESYFMLGEYREALQWCVEALRYDKNNLVLKTLEARILIGLGEYERAEELFREVLREEPYNFDAQFGMAELDVVRGRALQAKLWYEKAMSLQPRNRRAILSLALLYQAGDDLERAEELIKLALHHYPSHYMVQYLAGKLYLNRGELEKAEMHTKKALALNSSFPEGTLQLSRIYLLKGNYDDVVAAVNTLIQDHRNNHLLWYTLAAAYERIGEISESLQAYARVLRLRGDDEIARIASEALVMREFDPGSPERLSYARYHFEQGRALQERNYFQKALEEYRRGLMLAPFSKNGRVLYAEIFKAFGYYDKYLSELLVLESENLADDRIRDEIEIYSSLLDDEVSDNWGIRQYEVPLGSDAADNEARLIDRSMNSFSALLYYDEEKIETLHPLSSQVIADYFHMYLSEENRINLSEEAAPYPGFSGAFSQARTADADFFIVFSYRENGRAFSGECDLYNGGTGTLIRSFRVFRTGNDKVKNGLQKLAVYIDGDLPVRGMLLDKEFDTGIINLGSRDAIMEDDIFRIVAGPEAVLNPETLELSYPDDAVLGTFTVTKTDELLAEGDIESSLFFDLINPGDLVLPLPQEEENGEAAGDIQTEEEEQQEDEKVRQLSNLDLYREILKIQ